MAQIFLQQTDTASVDPIGDFGTGAIAPGNDLVTPAGNTATNGGAPGVVSLARFASFHGDVGRWGVMWETAAGECDSYTCPAGNWVVPFHVDAVQAADVIWTDCYVLRVDSFGVLQQTIGHSSPGLALPQFGGILTATVAGAVDTFSSGDRVVILCVFSWGGTDAVVDAFSDQVITTPMNSTGPSFTRIATRFMADFLGLTSGSQRAFSVAGCIKSASAALVKYVANFLGLTSGSQMAFSIASCKGPIRTSDYIGLSSGSQQVYAIADCCQPVASGSSGSRTSGSPLTGSLGTGSGGDVLFHTGGGCGPDNPCGPPQPPGVQQPGCDLTGYPDTLYLTVPGVHCSGFPASFTVPLYYYLGASVPFLLSTPVIYSGYIGWYTDPNLYVFYNPASGVFSTHCGPGGGIGLTLVQYPAVVYCILNPCVGPWQMHMEYDFAVGAADLQVDSTLLGGSVLTPPGIDLIYRPNNWAVSFCCGLTTASPTVTQ